MSDTSSWGPRPPEEKSGPPAPTPDSPRRTGLTFWEGGPPLKALLIVTLTIALLIPLSLVQNLVEERAERRQEITAEIGRDWGTDQTITGPVLMLPYEKTVRKTALNGTRTEVGTVREHILIFPDRLAIDAKLAPQARRRGMYEATLYRMAVTAEGSLTIPASIYERPELERILWSDAKLLFGLSDPRSLASDAAITVNGAARQFGPDLEPTGTDFMDAVLSAKDLNLSDIVGAKAREMSFSIAFEVNGSEALRILPLGGSTDVTVASAWPHPGFSGAYLPTAHDIRPDGFSAEWSISHLGRGYDGIVMADDFGPKLDRLISESAFAVTLAEPVTPYLMVTRAVKFGVLFPIFTFAALFLFDLRTGRDTNLVQYGMVGTSLSLFFLLLLALSEYLQFGLAYGVAATMILGQSAHYVWRVTNQARIGLLAAGLLAILYGLLFILLRLETASLLVGSLALFLALSGLMVATRKMDWIGKTESSAEPAR